MNRYPTRNFRRLFTEQLDRRYLMAADVIPEIEPNNSESSATSFALVTGQQVRLQGTSQSKDDKDYFSFTAPVGMQVSLDASAAAGAKVEVTTRTGSQVLETEPKDGLVKGKWQAEAGETYLVRMRSAEKTAATYDVLLESGDSSSNNNNNNNNNSGGDNNGGSSSGPEVEPNDRASLATQTELTSSAPLVLTGSASKRDRDFFRVDATSTGKVSIDTGTTGIKVSIETPTGTKLFESEPRDGITAGSFNVSVGQSFLVRARGITNSVTQYSLNLNLSGSTDNSTSPTPSTAAASSPDVWLDCTDDGQINALDALLVINHINDDSQSRGTDDALLSLDTNDDRIISALDALLVVNRINDSSRSADVNDTFDDSDIRKRKV